MTDEDLRWCDVCDDCSHYKAVGDEKYQCTLEGGRCRGYFAYKELKSENAALRERLERAVVNGKRFIVEKQIDGREVYVVCRYKVIKSYICTEYTREAAEARLAELKGEKK